VTRFGTVAALALLAGEALGHAALVASEPADGAVLEQAPAAVVLRFSEPVTPIAIGLVDRSGARAALRAEVDGVAVRAALPPGLPSGPYFVSYRVTSLDSHPVGGAVAFSVGSVERLRAPEVADAIGTGAPARAALRVVHDLALLVAVGGALFVLLVAPFPRQRSVLAAAAALAGAGAIASVGLHGAALLDLTLLDWPSWRIGFATTRGPAAIVACAGVGAIAAGALRRAGRAGTWLLALGAAVAIASFALSGHPAAAEPRALAATLIVAHVAAAAFWAGSLLGLLAILRSPESGRAAAPALSRFSNLGVFAVLMLMTAGIGFAAMQLHALAELASTTYGRWIAVKSGLLAGLIAVAAWNRLRLLPALKRDGPRAGYRFRRAIVAEIALMAATIGAAAILAQTPPPRSVPGAQHVAMSQEGYSARLVVAPASAGSNAITITLEKDGEGPFDPPELSLDISNPAAGIEAFTRSPRRVATGEYRLEGAELVAAGEWTIEIRARITEFDRVTFRARLTMR
jgi:copper transport protein